MYLMCKTGGEDDRIADCQKVNAKAMCYILDINCITTIQKKPRIGKWYFAARQHHFKPDTGHACEINATNTCSHVKELIDLFYTL